MLNLQISALTNAKMINVFQFTTCFGLVTGGRTYFDHSCLVILKQDAQKCVGSIKMRQTRREIRQTFRDSAILVSFQSLRRD